MENNDKWDWLMSFKVKLEDEVMPELVENRKRVKELELKMRELTELYNKWEGERKEWLSKVFKLETVLKSKQQ